VNCCPRYFAAILSQEPSTQTEGKGEQEVVRETWTVSAVPLQGQMSTLSVSSTRMASGASDVTNTCDRM